MTCEVNIVQDDKQDNNLIIIVDNKIFYEGEMCDAKGIGFISALIYAVNEKAEITNITIPR